MDGCDSDTSSVSQQSDSDISNVTQHLDSDISSVSQDLDSGDHDASSVSSDSEYSQTLDRINIFNQSLLDETIKEERESESLYDHDPLPIPVLVTDQRPPRVLEARNRIITVINRDPRIQGSCNLPTIGVTNYRSLGPKIRNVTTDI